MALSRRRRCASRPVMLFTAREIINIWRGESHLLPSVTRNEATGDAGERRGQAVPARPGASVPARPDPGTGARLCLGRTASVPWSLALPQPDGPKETGLVLLQTWHFAGSNRAAMGSSGAGSCPGAQPSGGNPLSPKSGIEAARANSSSGDGVSLSLINWGRREIIAVTLGASLASGRRWVVMQNPPEPVQSGVWEE